MPGLLEQIASDEVLDEAYVWLCDRREHYSHHDDVWDVRFHWPENQFVFRKDVKSYYASIDHDILYGHLAARIDDPRLLDLLRQYLRRTVYDDGLYEDVTLGISLGCPLSPLMGAVFLDMLDRRMDTTGLAYVRFMDDWVVLPPTRWKLRAAIEDEVAHG